jgi:hypothetical protein
MILKVAAIVFVFEGFFITKQPRDKGTKKKPLFLPFFVSLQ